MKTWHIWDPPDNVYVGLEPNFREKFFNIMFEKFGGKRPYARFLGVAQMTAKRYHKGYFEKKGVIYPLAIPISLFKKSKTLINKELIEELESNIIYLKAISRANAIYSPKLPFKESAAFYRTVSHIIGDGSASKGKTPYYSNQTQELRQQFMQDLLSFGDMKIYERKPLTTEMVYFPKVLSDILAHILNIKFSYPTHLPQSIFTANKKCKSALVQALFDDEGTVSTSISISMKSKRIIEQLKKLIERLMVSCTAVSKNNNNGCYTVSISKKDVLNIKRFKEKIGFSQHKKRKYLECTIKTKERVQRTRDQKFLKKEILSFLQKDDYSTMQIANQLQLSLGHTLKILKIMEKENKTKVKGHKNKFIWSTMVLPI
tara:strand:- start:3033 stop:4151 length:1119 start_codon:yes stop_codon:yes gene_type:complete